VVIGRYWDLSETMNVIVVIAASAGGLGPLRRIIELLPIPCPASIFIAMHIGAHPSVLPSLLSKAQGLPAAFAEDGELIEPGHIYVAPPDHHMILTSTYIRLNQGPKVHFTRPAADPLFNSAAEAYGMRVLGIVLSGHDGDGATGLRNIKKHGGLAVVQLPEEAEAPSMPAAALLADHPDLALAAEKIAQCVRRFCLGKIPRL
jgi:two-component system chemotaxis response regulator CheB